MIYGIGVDTAKIERIEKSIAQPRFLQRVYSAAEQGWLLGLAAARRGQSAAANFAAKEAFLKACGTGLGGFSLSEIGILRQESGAPYYKLEGVAAAWVKGQGLTAHLSLTHDGGLATAFCVLEKPQEQGIHKL